MIITEIGSRVTPVSPSAEANNDRPADPQYKAPQDESRRKTPRRKLQPDYVGRLVDTLA